MLGEERQQQPRGSLSQPEGRVYALQRLFLNPKLEPEGACITGRLLWLLMLLMMLFLLVLFPRLAGPTIE